MKSVPTIPRIKHWLAAICMTMAMVVSTPSVSRASSEEEVPSHDARLDGYREKVVLDSGGTAVVYICLGLLSVLGLGVLFINGKRSHLD